MGPRNSLSLKSFLKLFTVAALLLSFAGCPSQVKQGADSAPAHGSGMTMDQALAAAAGQLLGKMEQGVKVAVLNYSSPSVCLAEYVISEVEAGLIESGKVTVVDRKELELLRSEMKFQYSGEVNEETIQEAGRTLGAQLIITGAHTELAGTHRIMVRALVVQTAAVAAQYRTSVINDDVMTALLNNCGKSPAVPAAQVAQAGAAPAAAAPAPAAAPAAAKAAANYKVGGVGPAGGLVFYDKGNNNSGWRYLEAAPADLDRKLVIATEYIPEAEFKDRAVGGGKRNTEAFMREAANKGGGFGWAAQACDVYTANDFDDWYLPTRDELHFMYGHLHMQGLGDFRNEWYWSSTHSNGGYWFSENFKTGDQDRDGQGGKLQVRCIRQF